MKIHSTNYTNTFIQVADDSKTVKAEVPVAKNDKPTVASLQYDMISKHPYQYTSDDVIFGGYAIKNDLTEAEFEEARKQFFSKGQACLRASALGKRYGWGVHHNHEAKIALYPIESDEYQNLSNNPNIKVVKAMRSSK